MQACRKMRHRLLRKALRNYTPRIPVTVQSIPGTPYRILNGPMQPAILSDYLKRGLDIPAFNGDTSRELPVLATCLIDTEKVM